MAISWTAQAGSKLLKSSQKQEPAIYLLNWEPLMVPLEHLTAIIKETKENG
ncbi:MAG: hypothetical protein RXR51_06450 [Nitrososphaeria archaeon]